MREEHITLQVGLVEAAPQGTQRVPQHFWDINRGWVHTVRISLASLSVLPVIE